jgi:hypothetical protein
LLPTKEALLLPRDDPKVFEIFCEHLLSCTVGRVLYKDTVGYKRISGFVSVSCEAYTIAYIENCYDRWLAAAEDEVKDAESRKTYPKTMWTSEPQAATIYKGWAKPGIARYNQLQKTITELQKTKASKRLEKNLHERIQNGERTQKAKKKNSEVVEEEPEVLEIYSTEEENSDQDGENDSDDEDDHNEGEVNELEDAAVDDEDDEDEGEMECS